MTRREALLEAVIKDQDAQIAALTAAVARVEALCDSWDNGAPMSTCTTWWAASQVRAALPPDTDGA